MRRFLFMIISFLLLLIVSGVIIWQLFKEPKPSSLSIGIKADELMKYTVETDELTTNLAQHGFILLQFQLQADSAQGKEELELRMPQLRQLMIRIVSDKTLADLKGVEGISSLEDSFR